MKTTSNYQRVTRREPCAICGRAGWCRQSPDGALALCNRVASDRPAMGEGGGWIHRVNGRAAVTAAAASARRSDDPSAVAGKLSPAACELLNRQCRGALTVGRLEGLSRRMDMSMASLRRLGVGWHDALSVYTFPMRDADGRVIGLRTRDAAGRKRCVAGSRLGVVMPDDVLQHLREADTLEVLILTEGESDAAAALDLGERAIARPGCEARCEIVVDVARRLRPAGVVVVADADEPGQRGGHGLARRLAAAGLHARVLTLPGTKDLRAWKAISENNCHAFAALLDAPATKGLRWN